MLASKLDELRKLEIERETLLARIMERDGRIRDLEAASTTRGREEEGGGLKARVAELEAQLSARSLAASGLEDRLARADALARQSAAELRAREAKIELLERELEESLAWTAPPADDLRKIRGIGPKFEKILQSSGVRSFAQIAAWSPSDIESHASRLKISPSRIEREGWVESARSLVAGAKP